MPHDLSDLGSLINPKERTLRISKTIYVNGKETSKRVKKIKIVMFSSLGPQGAHTIGLSVCMFEIQRNAGVRHQLTPIELRRV